jgi:DNA ligase-1
MALFQPMLACREPPMLNTLRYPLLGSPKIDGVRGIVRSGIVYSRSMKPIPNSYVQETFGGRLFEGLDGELIVGKDPAAKSLCRRTVSAVMSQQNTFQTITFHVFDEIPKGALQAGNGYEPFRARHMRVVSRTPLPHTFPVQHHALTCAAEVERYEALMLSLGYEGIMLRDPNARYKFGRSTMREGGLIKLKRFQDAEAIIVAVLELEHNDNEPYTDETGRTKRSTHKAGKRPGGVMGRLVCQTIPATGDTFEIGTGFTDADRHWFWVNRDRLLGSILTYKHQPHGAHERPRSPVFIGLREPWDMPG